jgi:hypothetical protein
MKKLALLVFFVASFFLASLLLWEANRGRSGLSLMDHLRANIDTTHFPNFLKAATAEGLRHRRTSSKGSQALGELF